MIPCRWASSASRVRWGLSPELGKAGGLEEKGRELVENPTLRSLAVNRWVPVHELFSNPRGLGIFAPALGIGPAGRVAGYAPCFSSATA